MYKKKILRFDQEIKENVSLKNFSTFKTEPIAELFYLAKDSKKLMEVLKKAYEVNCPIIIIGGGSNILFNDGIIPGLTIRIATQSLIKEGNNVYTDAGVSLGRFLNFLNKENIYCMDGLTGVPGTIGGAIYGNAGAYGIETSEYLKTVTVFHPDKGLKEFKKEELEYTYRDSFFIGKSYVIIKASFDFSSISESSMSDEERQNSKDVLIQRMKKHPRSWSAGSFFKNPAGDKSAGYLIDKAGLKGMHVGDAMVSHEHGNFLINAGSANAKQICELKELVKEKVKEKWGIDLEEEVKFIGF